MNPSCKIEHKLTGASIEVSPSQHTEHVAVIMENPSQAMAINLTKLEANRLATFLLAWSEYSEENHG